MRGELSSMTPRGVTLALGAVFALFAALAMFTGCPGPDAQPAPGVTGTAGGKGVGGHGGGGAGGCGVSCVETGFKPCNACFTIGDCGPPATDKTLLVCNHSCGTEKSSHELWAVLFECLCGSDTKSGKCGPMCTKTCTQSGIDAGGCMMCIAAAVSSSCSAAYLACKADNK
jgi:hypothetical protein